jgi:hypothetical protein
MYSAGAGEEVFIFSTVEARFWVNCHLWKGLRKTV